MAEDKFRVTLFKTTIREGGEWPLKAGHNEPATAIDQAEEYLTMYGVPGQSYAEIHFNSDKEPHYRLFLMDESREQTEMNIGLLNTGAAKWNVEYPPGYGANLPLPPRWFDEIGEGDESSEDKAEEGEHKKDDESDKMKLEGEDDGDDSGEDEEDDADGDSEEDEDSDSEGQEEAEMPRLTFFGKMRGPMGWRKRAESDPEKPFNRMVVRFGVLDPDESQRSPVRERDTRVVVQFNEDDTARDRATFKVRLPEGVELQKQGRWLVAVIPVHDHEDD